MRNLGLERYEDAFCKNEIDDTVLPNLTAEDLKDLGVSIVGHRRKLLDAITTLRTRHSGVASPPATLADEKGTLYWKADSQSRSEQPHPRA